MATYTDITSFNNAVAVLVTDAVRSTSAADIRAALANVADSFEFKLPSYSSGDANKYLQINSSGNGLQWATVTGGGSYTLTTPVL